MTDTPLVIDPLALAAALAGSHRVTLGNGSTMSVAAAVVLDIDGKGIQTLTQDKGGVRYDLDGDGFADRTSWIGNTDGFLFLDRDKSGTLNSLAELDFTTDLAGAASGLAGLKAFDTNNDNTLSVTDTRFGDFFIWQDKNSNGVADSGEVSTLATVGVKVINLAVTAYTGTNSAGDVATIAKGSYQRTNGTTMDLVDAALTYNSVPKDGLTRPALAEASFDRKAKKYRITAKDGQMSVTGKYVTNTDSRAGGLLGSFEVGFKNITVGMMSTIILDLDGNGVSLSAKGKAHGWFDMNGDGSPDEMGWVGKHDGFLVIDRNNNGVIDNGAELSMLAEDPKARTSLAALAKLDSNGDKVIDATDARFAELKVWIDDNANGSTDAGELKTLGELGIQSISVDPHFVNQSVKPGQNLLVETATFTRTNGVIQTLGDAALAFHPSEPDPERAAALYAPNAPAPALADAMAIVSVASILPDADIMAAASQLVTAISTYDVGGQIGELTRGLWQNMASKDMMIAASLDR
jgi:hypothetical protein